MAGFCKEVMQPSFFGTLCGTLSELFRNSVRCSLGIRSGVPSQFSQVFTRGVQERSGGVRRVGERPDRTGLADRNEAPANWPAAWRPRRPGPGIGAEERTRTSTGVSPLPPQGSVSTSSTTSALHNHSGKFSISEGID